MLTLPSNIFSLYLGVLILVFVSEDRVVFVLVFARVCLEPMTKLGRDAYGSDLLVGGCSWNRFTVQGAKGIKG